MSNRIQEQIEKNENALRFLQKGRKYSFDGFSEILDPNYEDKKYELLEKIEHIIQNKYVSDLIGIHLEDAKLNQIEDKLTNYSNSLLRHLEILNDIVENPRNDFYLMSFIFNTEKPKYIILIAGYSIKDITRYKGLNFGLYVKKLSQNQFIEIYEDLLLEGQIEKHTLYEDQNRAINCHNFYNAETDNLRHGWFPYGALAIRSNSAQSTQDSFEDQAIVCFNDKLLSEFKTLKDRYHFPSIRGRTWEVNVVIEYNRASIMDAFVSEDNQLIIENNKGTKNYEDLELYIWPQELVYGDDMHIYKISGKRIY